MGNKHDDNDTDNTDNTFDLIAFHAAFIVEHMIFDTAEHYGLCLGCLAKEVKRQLETHLVDTTHEHNTDEIGTTEGSA
jgi:hypothetical protein